MGNKNEYRRALLTLLACAILYLPLRYLFTWAIGTYLCRGSLLNEVRERTLLLSENFTYCYTLLASLFLLLSIFKTQVIFLLKKVASTKMWAILLLALIVRLSWIIAFPVSPPSHFERYHSLAVEFAKTNSFVYPEIPCYPVGAIFLFGLIYKLFAAQLIYVKLFNLALSILTILLFYKIAEKIFGTVTARLFAVFYSLYPAHIAMIGIPSPDVVMTFVFALFIYLFIELREGWYKYFILGIIGGALLYIKPVFIFALLVPAFVNLSRRKYKNALNSILILVLALILVLPFCLLYGEPFFVTSHGGINILMGNNPAATGGYMDPEEAEGIPFIQTVEGNRRCRELAWGFIVKNPIKFLFLMPKKAAQILFKDTSCLTLSFTGLNMNGATKIALYIFNSIYYYLAMIFAFLSLRWRYAKNNIGGYLIMLGFIFSVLLSYMLSVGTDRYKYPFMPLIFILSLYYVFSDYLSANPRHSE